MPEILRPLARSDCKPDSSTDPTNMAPAARRTRPAPAISTWCRLTCWISPRNWVARGCRLAFMPKESTQNSWDRRSFLTAALGSAAALPLAAQNQQRVSPVPIARDWSGQTPVQYPDPDIVALDNRFRKYIVGNTVIKRLYTGTLWAEGPAWNGVGRYLVWSDIPNNVQMRWIEDDGRVTVFRNPSGYSNGNTFDYEGRQLSCEHGGRRVVRYESNGTVTVIADKFEGKRLNSPNDIVVHPDGSIWFTDPMYGINGNYEGFPAQKELKEAVYRVDPKSGEMVKLYDEMTGPNGICFSP